MKACNRYENVRDFIDQSDLRIEKNGPGIQKGAVTSTSVSERL